MKLFDGWAAWPFSAPQYWIYPLQTVVAGGLLWHWWERYPMGRPRGLLTGLGVGALVFVLWIAPQQWLGFAPRAEGFDPWFFASPAANWAELVMRFIRLVVVVPLLEEIFWRGFLARWLIDHHFEEVPIGAFHWRAFTITTLGFCFEHMPADWPAALLTGALYNWVAWRTQSLMTCVIAHAATNLLLGIYVMKTGQWGFW